MSRNGEEFSHFVALEFSKTSEIYELFISRVKEMQDCIKGIEGVGKMVKAHSLHLTIGVLRATEEEIPELTDRIVEVWSEYISMLGEPSSLAESFQGISFGDRG